MPCPLPHRTSPRIVFVRSHHEQVDQPHVDEADPLRRLLQLAGALAERRVDLLHRHPALERLGRDFTARNSLYKKIW